jgi:hypothetical protein
LPFNALKKRKTSIPAFNSNERRFELGKIRESTEIPGPGTYIEIEKSVDDNKKFVKPFGSGL